MLGLDPNFDSIYKGSFHSLVMRCDSKLSDHPASNSLHMMFPMHLGHCVLNLISSRPLQWGLDRILPICVVLYICGGRSETRGHQT